MISAAQAAFGRKLVRAFLSLDWRAEVRNDGHGGPRVEVRHPNTRGFGGERLLAAIVTLRQLPGSTKIVPKITYVVNLYEDAIMRCVARVRVDQGRSP